MLFYMSGFLIGIFYANLIAKQYLSGAGIFDKYVLRQYIQLKIDPNDYLIYLVQMRLFPVMLLIAAGCTGLRSLSAALYLVWTGFDTGVLAVMAVLGLGLKGIVLCIAGLFPHGIAYALAQITVLWYFYTFPETKWNPYKTAVTAGLFLTGLLLEAYLGPEMIRAVLRLSG